MRKTRYIRVNCKTREDWLASRAFGIGASEAAVAVGISTKWDTPYSLWRRKIGLDKPKTETAAMIQGHVQEPYIANLFSTEMKKTIIKQSAGDWIAVDPEYDFLRVSPDWVYWKGKSRREKDKAILECKSSISFDGDRDEDCIIGENISWFIQVQYQMYVMGYNEAHIGFLWVINNHHWFKKIKFDKHYTEEKIIQPLKETWNNNYMPAIQLIDSWIEKRCIKVNEDGTLILTEEQNNKIHKFAPPVNNASDIASRYPKSSDIVLYGNRVNLPDSNLSFFELLETYRHLRLQKKEIESKMNNFEDNVKMLMCDADSILGDDDKPVITYRANKPSMRFNSARFKSENPELYESYVELVQGARVFKIK